MEQAVEQSADIGDIAEQLTPVLDGAVRRQQCAGALVPAHYDLQQILLQVITPGPFWVFTEALQILAMGEAGQKDWRPGQKMAAPSAGEMKSSSCAEVARAGEHGHGLS